MRCLLMDLNSPRVVYFGFHFEDLEIIGRFEQIMVIPSAVRTGCEMGTALLMKFAERYASDISNMNGNPIL